jgi:hypothetical protein
MALALLTALPRSTVALTPLEELLLLSTTLVNPSVLTAHAVKYWALVVTAVETIEPTPAWVKRSIP